MDKAWDKIATVMVGIVLSITTWTFHQIQEQHDQIIDLNTKVALLVDNNNHIIPSPTNEIEREKLRRDLERQLHDLQVIHLQSQQGHHP